MSVLRPFMMLTAGAVLKQIDLARDDNNQTSFLAALKSPNGKPDTQWQFVKV